MDAPACCCSLSARGFSADRRCFFLSQRTDAQNLERDRRGFIPASLRWRLYDKGSIFSLCVCVWFVFPDCSVSIREREGMRINKYGPRLRIFCMDECAVRCTIHLLTIGCRQTSTKPFFTIHQSPISASCHAFAFSLATKPYPSVAPGPRTSLALPGFPRVKEGEALRFALLILLSRAALAMASSALKLSDENSRRRKAACRVVFLV